VRPSKPKPQLFQGLLDARQLPSTDILDAFAASLGVTSQSLTRINVRDVNVGGWWFPERDETGAVIGIQYRHADGSKKRIYGGSAGLTYADNWDTGVGPLLLPEGASDTCALMTLGLSAIGRPSNRAGCALLGAMLKPFERPIVVLGEYDQKADGQWPGKSGAIATATDLAKRLERPIAWALPPDRAKDARQWLMRHGGHDPSVLGRVFLDGLILETVSPPASIRVEHRKGPSVSLDEYRLMQVQARLRSLDQPAVYLDRCPTGTGKSYADLVAVESLIGRRAAAA
jgi:hypothetical protein